MLFTDEELDKCTAKKGDLLVCEGGNVGRACIWTEDFDIRIQNHIHKLRPYSKVEIKYFYYIFYLYKSAGLIGGKGIGIQGLSSGSLHNLILPIPSYNEQQRIVTKLEKVLPIVERYESEQNSLDYLNSEIKPRLRKSILQEAIQGRLVAQTDTDEPASVLLEKIRAEKERLVKDVKLKKSALEDSVIFKGDDNKYYENLNGEVIDITEQIPFDIPASWQWVRLRTLCNITTGASFKKEEASAQGDNKVRILRGGNIQPFRLQFKGDDIFINKELVNENILLRKNDLVTPAVTSLENICKMALIEQDYDDVSMGGFVFIIRGFYNNNSLAHYLQCVFSTPTTIEFVRSITNRSGQAFYNIGKERLSNTLIPIPPFNEIIRITTKLNSLFQSLN